MRGHTCAESGLSFWWYLYTQHVPQGRERFECKQHLRSLEDKARPLLVSPAHRCLRGGVEGCMIYLSCFQHRSCASITVTHKQQCSLLLFYLWTRDNNSWGGAFGLPWNSSVRGFDAGITPHCGSPPQGAKVICWCEFFSDVFRQMVETYI